MFHIVIIYTIWDICICLLYVYHMVYMCTILYCIYMFYIWNIIIYVYIVIRLYPLYMKTHHTSMV
jgi:hypothetical protein